MDQSIGDNVVKGPGDGWTDYSDYSGPLAKMKLKSKKLLWERRGDSKGKRSQMKTLNAFIIGC